MALKYAIDSKGEVFRVSENDPIRMPTLQTREEALNSFISEFFSRPIDGRPFRDKDSVCTLMTGNTEMAWFFTKTPLSSSSQDVKLANDLDAHPEITGNRRDFLENIYLDKNSVSDWYYLGVGCVELERNLYDGEYIDARYHSPIPYTRFLQLLDTDFKDYSLTNIGIELKYPQAFLETALVYPEDFDLKIKQELDLYMQAHGFENRYKDSNKATICISMITDYKGNCFPVYQQVKNCIKKTFKEAYNIRYKGNKITAQIKSEIGCERQLTLYVVSNDPPLVIIGGTDTMGIERFKNLLTSPELFNSKKWFDDKVVPVLDEISGQTKREYNRIFDKEY